MTTISLSGHAPSHQSLSQSYHSLPEPITVKALCHTLLYIVVPPKFNQPTVLQSMQSFNQ